MIYVLLFLDYLIVSLCQILWNYYDLYDLYDINKYNFKLSVSIEWKAKE